MKEVEVADILTGIGSMRQTPKFVSKTNKARKTAKEVSNKLEGLIPKTDKAKDILPKVKKKVPDILEGAKNLKKYYKNAYKVADNQRREAIVSRLSDEIKNKTKLPEEILVKRDFFNKMAKKHPEINNEKLFSFVKTLNIPDSIYQLPQKEKLNFFRQLEKNYLNIVGTHNKGDQQVVTSFITSSQRYPQNIKRTANAVFEKNKVGGALKSSSVMQSPPAGALPKKGISGVNNSLHRKNNIKLLQNQEYTPIQNMSAVRKFFTSGDTILRRAGNSGRELADLIQKQRKEADLLRGKYETIIRDALGRMRKKDRLAVTDILEEIKSKNTYLGKCFLLENQRF